MSTQKYNRKDVLEQLTGVWPEADWKGVTKDELLWLVEVALVLTTPQGRGMSETLLRYRQRYQPTVAYSGRASLNNGDVVAEFLAGREPHEVCAAVEQLLGLEDGELWARYQNLNPGQQRMNAGNRLRAALKRGDLTPEALH